MECAQIGVPGQLRCRVMRRAAASVPTRTPTVGRMFDPDHPSADYALRWPPAVFRDAARDMAALPQADWDAAWEQDAAWLLTDAFAGEVPAADLRRVTSTAIATMRARSERARGHEPPSTQPAALTAVNPGSSRAGAMVIAGLAGLTAAGRMTGDPREQYLRYLADAADRLPQHDQPVYWSERVRAGTDDGLGTGKEPTEGSSRLPHYRWTALVRELQHRGYLARVAPRPCTQTDDPPEEYWLEEATPRPARPYRIMAAGAGRRLGSADLLRPRRAGP